jgi:hypothetical protein
LSSGFSKWEFFSPDIELVVDPGLMGGGSVPLGDPPEVLRVTWTANVGR